MEEQEGVIKFQLLHEEAEFGINIDFTQINAWRTIMYQLGLIGRTRNRYQGLGFGNISQLIENKDHQFIISGTQTGQFKVLQNDQYCLILKADLINNSITSRGFCKPSSEAMTHASIYQQSSDIQCIIHAHCPEIWQQTKSLKIPYTEKQVEYGTPEMADAVACLFNSASFKQKSILTMLGHEDGVFTFGSTMQEAGLEIIKYLTLALAVDQTDDSS